jgi:hypothetical protein
VRRIVADVDQAVDVVGFTIAEFIPRQVMHLQQILKSFRSLKVTPPPRDNRPVLTDLGLGIAAVHLRCPSAGSDR